MKKNRIISGILVMSISMFMFTACGDKDTVDKKTSYKLTPSGTFPIVEEKVTLKAFAPASAPNSDLSYEKNEYTKWYEDKTNVHFEWVLSGPEDKNSKLSVLMASKDMPDIFFGTGFSTEQQVMYGTQKVLLPLNEYLNDEKNFSQRLFKIFPTAKKDMIMEDGNIYSMPSMFESKHSLVANRMWIYKPWLDKLGVGIPQTTEEFEAVLKAFKTNDMNGNGVNDEIAFAGSEKGWNTDIWTFLMNSFVYTSPAGKNAFIENGNVQLIWDRPEYKEGLKYINKLYSQGLIAPESFTQDGAQLVAMGSNIDNNVLGCAPGGAPFDVTTFEEGKKGRWTEFVCLPPLKGPSGTRYAAYSPVAPNAAASISANTKYPDVAFRVLDSFYDDEIGRSAGSGLKGKFWDKVPGEAGDVMENGKPVTEKYISIKYNAGVQENVNFAWGNIVGTTGEPIKDGEYVMPKNKETNLEYILYDSYKKYKDYIPSEDVYLPLLAFSVDESKVMTDKLTSLKSYVDEMRAKFIMSGNIDSEWDKYISTLNSIGINEIEKIYQAAYDRRVK